MAREPEACHRLRSALELWLWRRIIPRGWIVQFLVTFPAECQKIGFIIFTALTSKPLVVDFKVLQSSAFLTAPVITLQHAFAQMAIVNWIQP
jgi:hypothetical protein